jgi:hypothetical protein
MSGKFSYWRTNLVATRNGQIRTVGREYSDFLGANQNGDAQKDRERLPESHLGPYPVFQRKKQTLSYDTSACRPEMASQVARHSLVVITDSKHTTIQVLAFLDLFCSAVYSTYK